MATSAREFGTTRITSHRKGSYLMIAAGVLAILLPFFAGISVAILLGLVVIMAGSAYMMLAFGTRGVGLFILRVVIGSIFVLSGFDLVLHPAWGLITLTLFVSLLFFFEALTEIIAFFRVRQLPRSGWLLANGLITLVLAWMIWSSWPASAIWALGSLVGINLIMNGVAPIRLFSAETL